MVANGVSISERLRLAQRKSTKPEEFEIAVKDALALLFGDDCSLHLGGSRRPDVRLDFGSQTVVLDAKSDSQGRVSNPDPKWRVLQRYKQDNHANYVVVVGESFAKGQIRDFATQDGVLLMETEALCKAVEYESEYPYDKKSLFAMLFKTHGPILSSSDVKPSLEEEEADIELLRTIWGILKKRGYEVIDVPRLSAMLEGKTGEYFSDDRIRAALDRLVYFNVVSKEGDEYKRNHPFDEVEKKLVIVHAALKGSGVAERTAGQSAKAKVTLSLDEVPIFREYKGQTYHATLNPKDKSVVYAGKRYGTPSGAAHAITHTSINGWRWWFFEGSGNKKQLIDTLQQNNS